MVTIPEDELRAMPLIMGSRDTLALEPDSRVVELGNKKNASGCYREFYEHQGMNYTCLDWNAEDGALAFDFGKEIPEDVWVDVMGAALVTNFGFMEHVFTDNVQGWYNVNRLCSKKGCHLAMVMPYPGDWEHHGVYQPMLAWYAEWLEENGYAVLELSVNTDRRRRTIVVAARRTERYDGENYYHPPGELMHITPQNQRVNPHEKAFGG